MRNIDKSVLGVAGVKSETKPTGLSFELLSQTLLDVSGSFAWVTS